MRGRRWILLKSQMHDQEFSTRAFVQEQPGVSSAGGAGAQCWINLETKYACD